MKEELIGNGVKVEINQKDIIEAVVDEAIENFKQEFNQSMKDIENEESRIGEIISNFFRKKFKIKKTDYVFGEQVAFSSHTYVCRTEETMEGFSISKHLTVCFETHEEFRKSIEDYQCFKKEIFQRLENDPLFGEFVSPGYPEETIGNIEENRQKIERKMKVKFTKAHISKMTPSLQKELQKMLN